MKIVEKSIKIAEQLHPQYGRGFHHFAFVWKKNKLISIGRNSVLPSAKALYFGQKFNLPKCKEYKSLHAEISAISNAWGKVYLDSSFTLISLRLNNKLELRNAKPCEECQAVIDALNLKLVYSTWEEYETQNN